MGPGGGIGYTHPPASRDISVEFPLVKPFDGVLSLFLEWEIVKVATDSKLTVDTLLRDIEVLDVEEPLLANGGDEGASEFFLAFRGGVEREVDGGQVCPVKVGLCVRVWDKTR